MELPTRNRRQKLRKRVNPSKDGGHAEPKGKSRAPGEPSSRETITSAALSRDYPVPWSKNEVARAISWMEGHLSIMRRYWVSKYGEPTPWKDMLRIGTSDLNVKLRGEIHGGLDTLEEDVRRVIPLLYRNWDSFIKRVGSTRGWHVRDELHHEARRGAAHAYIKSVKILRKGVQRARGGDAIDEFRAIGPDMMLLWPTYWIFEDVRAGFNWIDLTEDQWEEVEKLGAQGRL